MTADLLTSVWEGKDCDLLPQLMELHRRDLMWPEGAVIVDANWGGGLFWKTCSWSVIGIDAVADRAKTIRADNRWLPIRDSCVDYLIYDPPQIQRMGKGRPDIRTEQYGIVRSLDIKGELLLPFMAEAERVLVKGGIVITKMADLIHWHIHRWQLFDTYECIKEVGLQPCDLVVKVRKRPGPQSSWNSDRQLHTRQRHSYFIVARKGGC